nr:MAG TPA: hypothetical protein [Caudoviricetes sp.]
MKELTTAIFFPFLNRTTTVYHTTNTTHRTTQNRKKSTRLNYGQNYALKS